LIPFECENSTDIEDWALQEPEPLDEKYLEHLKDVSRVYLNNVVKEITKVTNFQVVCSMDLEPSCIDVDGTSKSVRRILRELPDIRDPQTFIFKRLKIYKNPAEFRDGVNTDIYNKIMLKKISLVLQQFCNYMDYSAMGKPINLNKFRRGSNLFLESDIRKDGWTTHHSLIQACVEVLREFENTECLDYIMIIIKNMIIVNYDNTILKIKRGFGIGMFNQLATIVKVLVLKAAGYKNFLVNNDDIIIKTNRIYSEDFDSENDPRTSHEVKYLMTVLQKAGYIPYKKKTLISRCIRFCEEYYIHGDYSRDWTKSLSLYMVCFKTLESVNIINAKHFFNQCHLLYSYRISKLFLGIIRTLLLSTYIHETPYELDLPSALGGLTEGKPNNLDWSLRELFKSTPEIVGFWYSIRDKLNEFNKTYIAIKKHKEIALFKDYFIKYTNLPEELKVLESIDINQRVQSLHDSFSLLENPIRSSNRANFYKKLSSFRRQLLNKYLVHRNSVPDYYYREISRYYFYSGRNLAVPFEMLEYSKLGTETFKSIGKYIKLSTNPDSYYTGDLYTKIPAICKFLNLGSQSNQDRYSESGSIGLIQDESFQLWEDDGYLPEVPIKIYFIMQLRQFSKFPVAVFLELICRLGYMPYKLSIKREYLQIGDYPTDALVRYLEPLLPDVHLPRIKKSFKSSYSGLFNSTLKYWDTEFSNWCIYFIQDRYSGRMTQSLLSYLQLIEKNLIHIDRPEINLDYNLTIEHYAHIRDIVVVEDDWGEAWLDPNDLVDDEWGNSDWGEPLDEDASNDAYDYNEEERSSNSEIMDDRFGHLNWDEQNEVHSDIELESGPKSDYMDLSE